MARWLTFEAFCEEMGPRPSSRHTLERENNDAGYCPENCVWATRTQQARNKRTNRLVTYQAKRSRWWNGQNYLEFITRH